MRKTGYVDVVRGEQPQNHPLTKGKPMSLNATQQAVLAELFETDPEFRSIATKRMALAASEAEKRASALRSFSPAGGKQRGRPKGSKYVKKEKDGKEKDKKPAKAPKSETPAAQTQADRPDWKGKISAILKSAGKDGLRVSDIQDKLTAQGNPVSGGTLNTYLYGMKKEGAVRGEGTRGKTRYVLA